MEVPAVLTGSKPVISVWLSGVNTDIKKYFRCPVCGHKVFGYYDADGKIQMMSGNGEFVKPPKEIQCGGAITVEKNGQEITTRCKTIFKIG